MSRSGRSFRRGPSNTYTWFNAKEGTYRVRVEVRTTGSPILSAFADSLLFSVTTPPGTYLDPPVSADIPEYYHLDVLGSVRVVTDAAGNVVRRHEFLPFGEEWQPQTPAVDMRLFTGHERDVQTGLDYFGTRYYRPDLGRFSTPDECAISTDYLVDPQRWHRFGYVQNRPTRYVDPDGRESEEAQKSFFLNAMTALGSVAGALLGGGGGLIGGAAVGTAVEPGGGTIVGGLAGGVEGAAEGSVLGAVAGRTVAAAIVAGISYMAGDERHGGGKTGRKYNEDRRASAEEKYKDARQEYEKLRSKPNKTPADKQAEEVAKRQMEHWKRKMEEESEEHARKAQK